MKEHGCRGVCTVILYAVFSIILQYCFIKTLNRVQIYFRQVLEQNFFNVIDFFMHHPSQHSHDTCTKSGMEANFLDKPNLSETSHTK